MVPLREIKKILVAIVVRVSVSVRAASPIGEGEDVAVGVCEASPSGEASRSR
ncbi:hypothetical protein [Nostoc sp.]|uniref:hypothetical protein n=1 Tax=Nostoc sp. TaxID=1180 RepID=UPI002FF4B24F